MRPIRPSPRRFVLAALALIAPALAAQIPVKPESLVTVPPVAAPLPVRAVRVPSLVITGRGDSPAWATAPVTDAFTDVVPVEGAAPGLRTTVQVAYDAANLYVLVHAYDPHPDSVRALLSRRDVLTTSDRITVVLDPYLDGRTGYTFSVNAAGVQRDALVSNDQDEDDTWDGVWDAATSRNALGWTAEFRIPLSQLRFRPAPEQTFGFGVERDVARSGEQMSFPLIRRSRFGLISQIGTLVGLKGLEPHRRIELVPFIVAQSGPSAGDTSGRRLTTGTAGLDFKVGLSPNLTLDGTVNPDFGQVEADPADLNLTAFETFFQERRPFFVDGMSQFQCGGPCEGLFYTRRIGRSPQLSSQASDRTRTSILGATKLTGRLSHGVTVGVLDAITRHEVGVTGLTIEPQTNYLVGRLQQDYADGHGSLGLMATRVDRQTDSASALRLRQQATGVLVDASRRSADGNYALSGYAQVSDVRGSPEALARTQRASAHYYQRPDGPLTFDPTRTALRGDAEGVVFAKTGGSPLRSTVILQRTSPGLEANDLGYETRGDVQEAFVTVGLDFVNKSRHYRRLTLNALTDKQLTIAGLPFINVYNVNEAITLPNFWYARLSTSRDQVGTTCDRCARGGPAIRESPRTTLALALAGDRRQTLVPTTTLRYRRGDEGRSSFQGISAGLDLRVGTRVSLTLAPDISRNIADAQWSGAQRDSMGTHYTFTHLDQTTLALIMRANATLSPRLSFQLFAEPFVSSGHNTGLVEVADARAPAYANRYTPLAGDTPPDFNVKSFQMNSVLRWEYRPGSTLYLVWTQDRAQDDLDAGTFSASRDLGNLYRARSNNIFLVKASYWINP